MLEIVFRALVLVGYLCLMGAGFLAVMGVFWVAAAAWRRVRGA